MTKLEGFGCKASTAQVRNTFFCVFFFFSGVGLETALRYAQSNPKL